MNFGCPRSHRISWVRKRRLSKFDKFFCFSTNFTLKILQLEWDDGVRQDIKEKDGSCLLFIYIFHFTHSHKSQSRVVFFLFCLCSWSGRELFFGPSFALGLTACRQAHYLYTQLHFSIFFNTLKPQFTQNKITKVSESKFFCFLEYNVDRLCIWGVKDYPAIYPLNTAIAHFLISQFH